MMRRRSILQKIDRPQCWRECLAVFVYGERMISEFVRQAQAGMEELHVGLAQDRKASEAKAQRADRVLCAQEIDVDYMRVFEDPTLCEIEIAAATIRELLAEQKAVPTPL
jgi:hypothetical protein